MSETVTTGRLGRQSEIGQIIYRKGEGQLFHRSFSVNVTNLCPSSCTFCIRNMADAWNAGDDLFLSREPTVQELAAATEEALNSAGRDQSLLKVRICGYGEPLLFPDRIARVAQTVKDFDRNIVVQLITLGWPIYYQLEGIGGQLTFTRRPDHEVSRLIGNMRRAGVDWISVSVNAPTEDAYIKVVRPVQVAEGEAYSQVWSFMQECKDAGFRVIATMVALPTILESDTEALRNRLAHIGVPLNVRGLVRSRGGGRRPEALALKISER